MDFHAILNAPTGLKHPRLPQLPDIESFAKSEKESRLLGLARTLRLTGSPYVLPPGTPKDRAEIVREAMRKTFNDPDFIASIARSSATKRSRWRPRISPRRSATPPRDPELIEWFKVFSGAGPLPAR